MIGPGMSFYVTVFFLILLNDGAVSMRLPAC